MKNTRTKNSILIIMTSGFRQIITLIVTFISRTIFIRVLGAEYLGLNGLFSNVLTILALSELGIGTAISYYLYKPIAENNIERIKSLMLFYKTCYRIVGITIIVIGSSLIPILPLIVNLEKDLPINLYVVYFIYLLNTASSYLFFAYKQAIVSANQEQYKIEKIRITFTIINCIVDIFILLVARNYIVYLITRLLMTFLQNIITAIKIDKEYPYIKESAVKLRAKVEMKGFFKDIGSVSLFHVGSTLFNATDNIIISVMLGTVVVGYYSNYYMIILQVMSVFNLIIRSFTAGIGNIMAKEEKKRQFEIFQKLDFLAYGIAVVCIVCLYQLLNPFMRLWVGTVGNEYILSQTVVGILCISFYFDCTTQIMNVFRETSGHFTTGKNLQFIGGIVNIVLSIVLGYYFALEGIFAATIVSKGFITVIPFILGISRDVFEKEPTLLLINYTKKAIVAIVIVFITWFISYWIQIPDFFGFIIEGMISTIVPVLLLVLIYWRIPTIQNIRTKVRNYVYK